VSKGRLTRQELGWLLTQEAAGAAERLRVGVQVLKTNAPPPMADAVRVEIGPSPGKTAPEPNTGLDATLDALDDAMKMLSSLHQKPLAVRGRRGRIDLASLIWEVAPDARVSIEPGSGTEVFGDEGDLRRMMQVLVGQGTGAGSAVTIKREADDVRIAVVLGPDSSATAETERAWVSRMAIRYGGHYELEGGAEVLSLPADGVSERNERESLRKELDEARKQGEAYARELAAVFSQEEATTRPSTMPPMHVSSAGPSGGVDRFSALVRFAGGIAAELRHVLSPAARQVPPPRAPDAPPASMADGSSQERWDTVRRALSRAQDFVGALASLGGLDPGEPSTEIDLLEAARSTATTLAGRAEKGGVSIRIVGETPVVARTGARGAAILFRELVEQAIASSPRESEVLITVATGPDHGPRVTVDDAGTPLPASARRAFVNLELEPGTYGRSTSVPLYVASEIAAWQSAVLELADAPAGGVRVSVTYAER
jgi:two-component system, OmpR family, sensor kinase